MGVPPLLITGMHRSGTSATARLLHRAGLDLGTRLMPPRLDNPLGYYEDLEFYDLNRALIAAGVGDDPRYQPDWAFPDRIVPGRLAPLRPRAAALIAGLGARGRAWGFKDPRTAVLLDFYDDLVPDARYLFVYRAPWEVVESLIRTRERPLRGRAGVALRAWMTYNERVLAFRERSPARTALVHVDGVAHRPDAVVGLVQAQVRDVAPTTLDAGGARGAFAGDLMRRSDAGSPLAELLAADHPEAIALYAQLEAAADIGELEPPRNGGPPAVAVEAARGILPLDVVLAGAGTETVPDAVLVARPAAGAAPEAAADAGIAGLPGDLIAVVFDARPRPDGLAAAVAALEDDPRLGAVLLAAGDDGLLPGEHDPLADADAGAAIVLRRDAWLATRGFAAVDPPDGFEAWSFAVGCHARGIRTIRIAGAVGAPLVARDASDARRHVLERYPTLAAGRALALKAERDRLTAERDQATAARDQATAARDQAAAASERVAGQLDQLRATRSWRLVTRWWRLKARLRGFRGRG